jgi:Meiotically up-regulated gene 113
MSIATGREDGAEPLTSTVAPVAPALEPLDGDEAMRIEIENAILKDEGTLGDIYRRAKAGENPEEIQVATTAYVLYQLKTARVLIDGTPLPTAPSVAGRTAQALRRILKENEFSPQTRVELERRLAILETRASDRHAKAVEDKQALQATADAEEHAVPGVYVYSLPHYLRHPYDEASGRTLMKVGRADRNVIKRFRDQTRTTALPEDPVLLRVYPCNEDGSTDLEGKFHRLLEAADHDRSKARTGGTEWFLTSVKFLDEIAAILKLDVREVAELADPVD